MSALLLDESAGRLSLHASVAAHGENAAWVSLLLLSAAALQAADAEAKVDHGFADAFNARPAHSTHPVSGARSDPDEMLFIMKNVYVPRGQQQPALVGRWRMRLDRVESFT